MTGRRRRHCVMLLLVLAEDGGLDAREPLVDLLALLLGAAGSHGGDPDREHALLLGGLSWWFR
jgi:hypothetical protein